MEDNQNGTKIRRIAAEPSLTRTAIRKMDKDYLIMEEDSSPEVAREHIVKDLMRIFDSLLGCTSKRTGVGLAFMTTGKSKQVYGNRPKPDNGTQSKLEQQIYQRIKGLVNANSPNIGFALDVLYNNAEYFYNKANVPLSFGIFINSLVTFLEGHDCLNICPEEMVKMRALLARG